MWEPTKAPTLFNNITPLDMSKVHLTVPYKCNGTKESYVQLICAMTGIGYAEILHYMEKANQFQIRLADAMEEYMEHEEDYITNIQEPKGITNLKILSNAFYIELERKLIDMGFDSEIICDGIVICGISVDFEVRRPDDYTPYNNLGEIVEYLTQKAGEALCERISEETYVNVLYDLGANKADVYTSASWTADNEESYEDKVATIANYRKKNDLFSLNAWCDVSGYEYWVIQREEPNYVSVDVVLKKDPHQYSEEEIERIIEAVAEAEEYFCDL